MDKPEVQIAEMSADIRYITKSVEELKGMLAAHIEKTDERIGKLSDRVRELEDWKLQFVAKFTVYSSLALVLGSIIAQVLLKLLGKYI